jgi:ferrous iron transport protein B
LNNESLTIALVGNPNTGKSTVFNGLTGLKQKVGNYPGVTVERKTGTLKLDGTSHTIIDLPGSYSLSPKSMDERIAYETLTGVYEYEKQPDLVFVIVDASNIDRNLYLATQIMDLGIPMCILLNMMDVAEEKGLSFDTADMSDKMGVPVIPITAKKQGEVEKVTAFISKRMFSKPEPQRWNPSVNLLRSSLFITENWIKPHLKLPEHTHFVESLRILSNNQIEEEFSTHSSFETFKDVVSKARSMMEDAGANWMADEVLARYQFIHDCTSSAEQSPEKQGQDSLSDKIDAVVTHSVFGPLIFVAILLIMFQSIFSWAAPFMDLIDLAFVETGQFVTDTLPEGMLNDLLVEGVLAGLGGVVIFLPQIMFLFFFISILEGTGYMARAAFIMDGFMTRIGLHGRSVVPLMSGFACAVPGIMATRTIENWRDRLITIMVLPFMACSARLPVYALMIAAFIPNEYLLGIFSYQGLTFFGLYFFGIIVAVFAAVVFKKIFSDSKPTPFIMELPSYKMPSMKSVIQNMFERGWIFVTEAGKVIMAISIVLWFLASFPKVDIPSSVSQTGDITQTEQAQENSFDATVSPEAYQLKHSYAGKFGRAIEPAIEPLGFDWKIGIGLITSFAAREVMVGTLNTIYSIESNSDEIQTLKQKLINDTNSNTGKPVYSTLTALSLMVFFALAMQCMSTLAIVRRETNSWKWPVVMLIYMTTLAYLSSLALFQIGTYLGY